jgi:hypothetical protein
MENSILSYIEVKLNQRGEDSFMFNILNFLAEMPAEIYLVGDVAYYDLEEANENSNGVSIKVIPLR